MTVLLEGNCIITKRKTIEQKYQGGLQQYIEDIPNSTFCMDEHLTVVMFQTPDDAYTWIRRLEAHDLVYLKRGKFIDMALVDFKQGPLHKSNWLEFSKTRVHTISFDLDVRLYTCRLKGTEDKGFESLATPIGWSLKRSLSANYLNTHPGQKASDRFKLVNHSNKVDSYRDEHAGTNIFVGRPFGPTNQVQESYKHCDKAVELILSELNNLQLSIEESTSDDSQETVDLIFRYLKEAAHLHPHNWKAHYYLGRMFKHQNDLDSAHQHFEKAYNLNTNEQNVCRLFMELCVNLNKFEDALDVARAALRSWPRESEWIADYGYALYLNGRSEKGLQLMEKALRLNPDDSVTSTRISLIHKNDSNESEWKKVANKAMENLMKAGVPYHKGIIGLIQDLEYHYLAEQGEILSSLKQANLYISTDVRIHSQAFNLTFEAGLQVFYYWAASFHPEDYIKLRSEYILHELEKSI